MIRTSNKNDDWEETVLATVVNLIGGGTPKTSISEYWNGNIPWLSVVDFNNDNRWVVDTEKTITNKGLENSSTKILNPGDLIISARGTVGALAQLKRPMAFNQSCYGIRSKDEVTDNDFLYYLIKYSLKKFLRNVHGAVFDTITKQTFENISVFLPPLSEQKSIAAVLSSFDNKIELLRKQNKTLEHLAQAVFKECVIKKSYKNQRFGDFVEVKRGGSPRPIQDYISDEGYRWLKISDASATPSPYLFRIKEHIKKEGIKKTILLNSGSLVLSNSATPGIPKILAVDSCIHDGWLYFPKSKFSIEFMYLLFLDIRKQLVQQGSGSVFTNLKTDILKDYEIPVLKDDDLQNFDITIKPVFRKIFNNESQIQTLIKIRDILLPKLMNGEVRVKI